MHASFSGHGHEVGVADPTWQAVQVKMAGDSCPGRTPEIHPKIHAIRFVKVFERRFNPLRELHHFVQRRRFAQRKLRDVCVRHHHHVSGGIGIAIENYKTRCTAAHHQRNVVIVARGCIAKNAFRLLAGNRLGNILVAPRGPQIVHRVSVLARGKLTACVACGKTKNQECVLFPEPPAAASAAVVIAAASSLFTKSFSSLLGLKKGIRFAGTSTFSPVFGLRPTRPLRCRVRKLPKPRISIFSPFWMAPMMLSKMVSTMVSDSLRGSSVTFRTSSIRSAFVNVGCLVIVATPRFRVPR